jgi:glycosyltransferase involved in cell wall biosynthesis
MSALQPPAVSVVMSVHNGATHLRESVESILAQEDVDLEFVVVDDGSTYDTAAILRAYVARDPRVRLLEQSNTGLTIALLRGCAEARGRYIARQDVGDVSLPGRLFAQKVALDHDEGVSFVSCWTEFVGPGGEFLFQGTGTRKASTAVSILSRDEVTGAIDGPSCHPSVMFRKDAYRAAGGYRKEFYFGQDWDLWYRLAEVGKFKMIGRTLYRAAITPESISGSHRDAQEKLGALARAALFRRLDGRSEEEILKEAASVGPTLNQGTDRQAEAAWLYFIGECLRRNGDSRARLYLWEAARKNPLGLKSWIRLVQSVATRAASQASRNS